MNDLLSALEPAERDAVRDAPQPRWTEPMLATLTDDRFDDAQWIYERKLDGVRILVFRRKDEIRLVTRNGEERNATYPEIVEALQDLPMPDLVADGEIVAFAGRVTSFSRLQERMQVRDEAEARARAERIRAYLYLFDLLHVQGHDLTEVPLRARKKLLKRTLAFRSPIRFTPHRNEEGRSYWKEACRKGWEGVIAKDATSPYVHGRSRSWLKFKCVHEQEFVVGGFTEPGGERAGFGAMLLGYHEGEDFVYAGKVGTGWDDETLERLRADMDRLERSTSPFDRGDPPVNGTHWITPRMVVEIAFTEWTDAGRLRHPRYLGQRNDKEAEDVVRERPEEAR